MLDERGLYVSIGAKRNVCVFFLFFSSYGLRFFFVFGRGFNGGFYKG